MRRLHLEGTIFGAYFIGIVFGILLCWKLPEAFCRQLSVYRLVSEELFLQTGDFRQQLMFCFARRMIMLCVLFATYFSSFLPLRYIAAAYIGTVLSVSVSVLTLFYQSFGLLFCGAVFLPQSLCYGWVIYELLAGQMKEILLPRILFLRMGGVAVVWSVGILLEVVVQHRLLRLLTLFFAGR